jgi:putative ABC transport system substrate-binding protein
MVNRRSFNVRLATGALLAARWPAARAQSTNVPRVGFLLYSSPREEPLGALLEGLQALGYIDGKTIAIEYHSAEGIPERLPAVAAALVRRNPAVIFALGGDVTPAAQQATSSIPIVAWVSNDPIQTGLVKSLGRPEGNVTGITLVYDELAGKTLGLLKDAVPSITRVAVLWNPDHADPEFRATNQTAGTLGVRVQSLEVRRAQDFDAAFKAALAERAQALVIVSSRLMSKGRQQIAEFAAANRIIVAGGWGEWTKDGALLTYGPDTRELMQRIASYIVKILRGARPSDLPIERPTRFELVINLKTAKAFDLALPPSLLARADRVIS